MKLAYTSFVAGLGFLAGKAEATVLKSYDFEGTDPDPLLEWTGKSEGSHSGTIVLKTDNRAVSFTSLIGSGDIFSVWTTPQTADVFFRLYLDKIPCSGACFGHSLGYPGAHGWDVCDAYSTVYPAAEEWLVCMVAAFPANQHIMIEDFPTSNPSSCPAENAAGDAYYGDIVVKSQASSPVEFTGCLTLEGLFDEEIKPACPCDPQQSLTVFIDCVEQAVQVLRNDNIITDVEKDELNQMARAATSCGIPDDRIPEMEGDPHVKTWGGKWFDYHGECDLVLVNAPSFANGKSLLIQVRTTIRHDYSYINSGAVKVGDDVFEVDSWGQHALNGIDAPSVLEEEGIAGYPIYHSVRSDGKQHKFDIVIDSQQNITLATFKDLVSVKIVGGTKKDFGDSTGIMGSFDGTILMRDGTPLLDIDDSQQANAFGQEWQVLEEEPMLFRTVRSPQAPKEKCLLPSDVTKESRHVRRRLEERTISKEAAEMACGHFSGGKFDACVFDVIAVGDLDIAQAGAF